MTTMILPYPHDYTTTTIGRATHSKTHARHRSKIEIINSILTSVSQAENETAPKTRIMYATELSWSQLRKYISYLIENEMLTCRPASMAELAESPNAKQLYTITMKSKIFLKLYSSMYKDDLLYGLSGEGEHHQSKDGGQA